ncbi:uncharacterized protein N7482_003542 [Penicillium canariense]|uniref:Uncharacterized protein n=1 Tax=Penicillium canariense TaxID=189055 RepID=A0A9W9LPP6_9EURO|nr:uncharacterized protein N7482_003542 [Penicillium canariense]KAJ5167948.1 hypothetical protein N7482_003542 [Penicillium canariense]
MQLVVSDVSSSSSRAPWPNSERSEFLALLGACSLGEVGLVKLPPVMRPHKETATTLLTPRLGRESSSKLSRLGKSEVPASPGDYKYPRPPSLTFPLPTLLLCTSLHSSASSTGFPTLVLFQLDCHSPAPGTPFYLHLTFILGQKFTMKPFKSSTRTVKRFSLTLSAFAAVVPALIRS